MKFMIISRKKLEDELADAYGSGAEFGEENAQERLEQNAKTIKDKNRSIKRLSDELKDATELHEDELNRLQKKIELFEEQREELRDAYKTQVENDDKAAALEAIKEGLDRKQAAIRDRESKLNSEEEHNYKKGYADGVADGLRKIGEITAKDRENAMKIAMVSAASHTPTANLKELNDVHKLTDGSEE